MSQCDCAQNQPKKYFMDLMKSPGENHSKLTRVYSGRTGDLVGDARIAWKWFLSGCSSVSKPESAPRLYGIYYDIFVDLVELSKRDPADSCSDKYAFLRIVSEDGSYCFICVISDDFKVVTGHGRITPGAALSDIFVEPHQRYNIPQIENVTVMELFTGYGAPKNDLIYNYASQLETSVIASS